MSRDPHVQVNLGAEVDLHVFGRLLQAMFGPAGPTRLDPDVARWEDDGGPPAPDPVRYTHTILPPDDPGYIGRWWTTYRLEGGERVPTLHTGPPAAEWFARTFHGDELR